ncbi:MAG TPA: helix-turn-helix transcriptional regulator [Allosphingosinicella sp.]|nr:helix-turn-helix transcriptional regulator [Allosphingosinicella sp.]
MSVDSDLLARLREALALPQEALAAALGLGTAELRSIENGRRPFPPGAEAALAALIDKARAAMLEAAAPPPPTMAGKPELLACPFCDETPHTERNSAMPGGLVVVHDGPPHCPIRDGYFSVEQWNTRPTPALPDERAPIDMLLFCPKCGVKHVDDPEPGMVRKGVSEEPWTNPPHRSHLCHACYTIWRPADVPTNGVERLKTTGKADTFDLNEIVALTTHPAPALPDERVQRIDRRLEALEQLYPGMNRVFADRDGEWSLPLLRREILAALSTPVAPLADGDWVKVFTPLPKEEARLLRDYGVGDPDEAAPLPDKEAVETIKTAIRVSIAFLGRGPGGTNNGDPAKWASLCDQVSAELAKADRALASIPSTEGGLREALVEIAAQKLSVEIEDDDSADFIGGYDSCVERAREALAAASPPGPTEGER